MIHALTNDPALALLLLKMVPSKLILHIQLSSPGGTNAQVFYNTTGARDFDEAHSVRTPIHKGDNDLVVEVTDPNFPLRGYKRNYWTDAP